MPAFELNLVKNTIGLTFLFLSALIFEGWSWPSMTAREWLIVIVSGVLGLSVADTLYIKALSLIGAGRTAIVATLYSPFIILLSLFYLDESLSFWQLSGLLLIASGILLTIFDRKLRSVESGHLYKGIAYGIGGIFLTAFSVVIIKPILEQQDFFWFATVRIAIGVLGMILFSVITGKVAKSILEFKQPHNWLAIFISGFTGAYLSLGLWLAGFKYTDATTASILNETSTIFIVLLAWLFLKEAMSFKKAMAVALSVCGVLLIVLH
jgi:drug/metabolite transporter (DMT)-like permease